MEPAVVDRLLEISALFRADMQNSLAGTSLTETRVHALWVLQHSGPMTQQALAAALGTTPRSVSALVDGLATAGYVVREQHPDDRRAFLVTLTAAAHTVMTRMQSDHEQLTASLLDAVAEDDRPAFARGVDAVRERLRTLVDTEHVDYGDLERGGGA